MNKNNFVRPHKAEVDNFTLYIIKSRVEKGLFVNGKIFT